MGLADAQGPVKTLFMDEISTGLDSSTTYQIVRCTGNFVHLREGTVLMALLQPAPETYNLFDDIMLMAEGHIVFHGPREEVLASIRQTCLDPWATALPLLAAQGAHAYFTSKSL
jgi:ABC-type multidrug transport system ATPase subunit